MMNKNDLTDRRGTANSAKAAMIETYRAAQAAAAPRLLELQRERAAVAEARKQRHEIRDAKKREEKAYLASQTEKALAAAAEAAAIAEAEAAATAAREAQDAMINSIVNDHADRKAARDQRYANRKAAARRG